MVKAGIQESCLHQKAVQRTAVLSSLLSLWKALDDDAHRALDFYTLHFQSFKRVLISEFPHGSKK